MGTSDRELFRAVMVRSRPRLVLSMCCTTSFTVKIEREKKIPSMSLGNPSSVWIRRLIGARP